MDAMLASPLLPCLGMFVAIMACLELGRWLGRWQARLGNAAAPGSAAIDSAIFALLGLMLAFAFAGAAQRFDARRDLIVAEANAIGTASLRIDLAPVDSQPALRNAFQRYADSRVAAYKVAGDQQQFDARLAKSAAIQQEIWALAIAAGRRPDAVPATNMLLLPALNEMIDITATRAFARLMHPPAIIYILLFVLTCSAAVLAGYGMAADRRRDLARQASFAALMTAVLYVTVDLEFPRLGLIRVDDFEAAVVAASRPQAIAPAAATAP